MSKNTRLVYSTDQGRIKESEQTSSEFSGDGVARIHRETKGRKGKGVTLIKGLHLNDNDLKNLAKKLKQSCGVGGSVKNGVIEVQTDDREKLKTLLEQAGHKAKIAGG